MGTSLIPSSVGPQISDDADPSIAANTSIALARNGLRMMNTNPDARQAATSLEAKTTTPAFRSPAYWDMADDWQTVRDLFVGTKAVRANAWRYLPRNLAEIPDEYAKRILRTETFPGFAQSIKGLTGLVFRNDPVLEKDVPPQIVADAEDIDGEGTALPVFARQVFQDGMTTGHVGILIDAPAVPKVLRPQLPLRLDQEMALGMRPYWVMIAAENIYSWRIQKFGKVRVLTQLVLHESTEEPVNDFGVNTISRFRIFRCDPITGVVTYELREGVTDTDPGKIIDEGVIPNQIRIPFVVIYCGQKLGPLRSRPPLLDLAYANIAHTQVSSDRRNSLHIASSPILVFKGRPIKQQVDDAGNPKQQVVGSNVGLDVPEKGDVKYVEHQGHALAATQSELQDLEQRMSALGLAMLQRKSLAAETAQAKKLDKTEKDALIGVAARSCADGLEQCLMFHAAYYNLADGGSIFMNRDFSDFLLDPQTALLLSQMVAQDQLDLETMWSVLQNRGILPEDMDHAAVKKNINEQIRQTMNQIAIGRNGVMTGLNQPKALPPGGGTPTDPSTLPTA